MHQLKEAIKAYNAKLVIISDIAGFFLDKDIPEVEALRIFSYVAVYLSNFARENQVIIIATYPPRADTSRNNSFTNKHVRRQMLFCQLAERVTPEKSP
jgi:hypothetical protein